MAAIPECQAEARLADRNWKPFLVDLLTGVGTSVLVLIVAIAVRRHHILLAVLMVALAVGAAVVRSGREPAMAWAHGLLVGASIAGPIVALVVLAAGGKQDPAVWAFLVTVLVGCAAVAWATSLCKSGAGMTGVVAFAGSTLAVWLIWTVGSGMIGPHPKLVRMNTPLPELGLKRMDGTPIPESELQGRVTVLDFWGTWCASCVEEMPVLNEVAASYSMNPNVQVLLVNPELNGDEPGRIKAFLRKRGISIPVALDPAQSCFKLHTDLFPTTVVLDRLGRMRYERTGYAGAYNTRRELHREVDELLAEQ